MKKREREENKFIERMKSDYTFRTFVFSALSFLAAVAFAAYNVFLAVVYQSPFNLGTSVYYALLICVRSYVILAESKFNKAGYNDGQIENGRKKLFFIQSIFLLAIDLALIAPITMMVLQQKNVNYSEIHAIMIAAYTVYKIVTATINFIKTRKSNHLSVKILRNINFVDALVSIISLQYTLIMTFNDGTLGDIFTLCATSTFAIWAFITVISVLTLIEAVKIIKSQKAQNVDERNK